MGNGLVWGGSSLMTCSPACLESSDAGEQSYSFPL